MGESASNCIEIRQVANGYVVLPPAGPGHYTPSAKIYVFETFEALVTWLRDWSEKAKV